jgi:aryl-alcohol dehydrogenase-like predicted oxidoreductase
MPMSMNDDGVMPSERDSIATIHAALDAGVTLIDTADIYAPSWDTMGHNESLVGRAVRSYGGNKDDLVIATKGGITRSEGERFGRDGSLEYLRSAVENSLRRLQVDVIDLYQWHRPDRWKVYGDVVGHFKTLQEEGKIRAIGISNANVEEISVARKVLGEGGLSSVQNEFSPRHASSYDELTYCEKHGIAFLPWSPLGGTGGGAREVGRKYSAFAEIGAAHGVSSQQVVLAWELSLGHHMIPIPGARRVRSITDSVAAVSLNLTEDELARCSAAVGLDAAAA